MNKQKLLKACLPFHYDAIAKDAVNEAIREQRSYIPLPLVPFTLKVIKKRYQETGVQCRGIYFN